MGSVLNFEAAQRQRDPAYAAQLRAVQACDALRDLLLVDTPGAALAVALAEVQGAVNAVRR